MKFKTQVADFQVLLNKIMPAIPAKTQVEAFEHILLRLNGVNLVAISSDFEMNIKSTIEVAGVDDGEILIPAKKVNELIKVMDSSADVIFDCPADSSEVKITSGKNKFVVKGMEAENYVELPALLEADPPTLENLSKSQAFFKKTEIQRLSEKTHFAASGEEYRLNMSGVLFQFRESYVNAVSTDSYKLIRATNFSGETLYPQEIDIIVPLRTIEIMRKSANDLIMTISEDNGKYSYLRLDFGDTVAITRLIDANFPKYEAIIPVMSNAEASLDISDLLRALKQVTPIVADKTKKCKLTFTTNGLTVSSENEMLGETAVCDLPAEFKDTSNNNKFPDGYVASFNIKYLEEILQNITPNDTSDNLVLFYFISPEKAALIKPKSEQDLLTMILMPIRV